MRKSILCFICVLSGLHLFSQKPFKRNTLYAELLGTGGILSANYERQLSAKPGVGFHIGIGKGGDWGAIPVGIKYIVNLKYQVSFFETGAAVNFTSRSMWQDLPLNTNDSEKFSFAFFPSIGYRYHARSGFMGRVNYTPYFSKWNNELLFFGVSAGWRF